MADDQRPRVEALLPEFANELVTAVLLDDDEADLATQIPALEFWGRCSCEDEFCASFYTGARPRGAWSDDGEHRNVGVAVDEGMVILDVVDGVIRYVEVLDRTDVKQLVETLPAMEPYGS